MRRKAESQQGDRKRKSGYEERSKKVQNLQERLDRRREEEMEKRLDKRKGEEWC